MWLSINTLVRAVSCSIKQTKRNSLSNKITHELFLTDSWSDFWSTSMAGPRCQSDIYLHFSTKTCQCIHEFFTRFYLRVLGPERNLQKLCSEFYNIFPPEIRVNFGAYQEARNVSFSENFAYVLNGGTLKLL